MLDTGHLLGNIELACAINQYRPHLIGGFVNQMINRILYLEPDQEAAITVISFRIYPTVIKFSLIYQKKLFFPQKFILIIPLLMTGNYFLISIKQLKLETQNRLHL